MKTNKGIVVSGGQFEAAAVAIGNGAVASVRRQDETERLRFELARLSELVQAHASRLPDAPEVVQTLKDASAEAEAPKPDAWRIGALLSKVAGSVKSVASIATAVDDVVQLVKRFV